MMSLWGTLRQEKESRMSPNTWNAPKITHVTIALQSIINLHTFNFFLPKNNICLIVARREAKKRCDGDTFQWQRNKKANKTSAGSVREKLQRQEGWFPAKTSVNSHFCRDLFALPLLDEFSPCYLPSTNTAESFRIIDTTRSVYSAN